MLDFKLLYDTNKFISIISIGFGEFFDINLDL